MSVTQTTTTPNKLPLNQTPLVKNLCQSKVSKSSNQTFPILQSKSSHPRPRLRPRPQPHLSSWPRPQHGFSMATPTATTLFGHAPAYLCGHAHIRGHAHSLPWPWEMSPTWSWCTSCNLTTLGCDWHSLRAATSRCVFASSLGVVGGRRVSLSHRFRLSPPAHPPCPPCPPAAEDLDSELLASLALAAAATHREAALAQRGLPQVQLVLLEEGRLLGAGGVGQGP